MKKADAKLQAMGLLGLALGAAALSAGCGGTTPAAPQRGPVEVTTVTVSPTAVVLTTELPGRTSAFLVAEVRPQVSGILQERLFEEGADVKAGDLLFQIDPAQYEAAVAEAEAALAAAEALLPAVQSRAQRVKDAATTHAASQQDADDAESALQAAVARVAASKAALERARINLAYTPLRAPISGRIGKAALTVGALVTAHQPIPLAVIQQIDPIYVDVTQASADLLRLQRRGVSGELTRDETQRKVRLLLEDGTPYPLEGTLQFRDVTVDPTTGSVTLRMVFPNPDQILLPGMFVRAIVEEGVNEEALLVPQPGVTRDVRGRPIAWVVNAAGIVERRDLELDRAIGDAWLLISGLAAGDRVIIEGTQKVREGEKVLAVPDAGQAPAAAAIAEEESSQGLE